MMLVFVCAKLLARCCFGLRLISVLLKHSVGGLKNDLWLKKCLILLWLPLKVDGKLR